MRILFLCKDNGTRSQMAEGLARQMYEGEHQLLSAGIEAGKLHPLAVEAMKEINVDISKHRPKLVPEVQDHDLDLIVVVCERDISATILPKAIKRLHWPIVDPLDPPAGQEELRTRMRDVRMALSKHLKGLGKMKIKAQTAV